MNLLQRCAGTTSPTVEHATYFRFALRYGMIRRDAARRLATLCVGGGMGVSLLVER